MQVMLEVTVVAQTLHLEQVINNFRNRYGSFFSDSLSTVLGGMSILLYGVIASNGLKVLIKERVDFGQMRNLIIASAMLEELSLNSVQLPFRYCPISPNENHLELDLVIRK